MNEPALSTAPDPVTEPRERILASAEKLFATRGYSAVGVRQLASEAGVNIAMISYYFGSKQGVLEELINRFFDLYEAAAEEVFKLDLDPECRLRELVRKIVALFAERPRLVRIAMTELPLEATDLARFKAERIHKFLQTFHGFSSQTPMRGDLDPQVAAIRGPALIATLASHFLMQPVLAQMKLVELDEAFYKKLPEVLADLLLAGFHSVIAKDREGKYDRCAGELG
jgi:AcrR family transcriptional regulator